MESSDERPLIRWVRHGVMALFVVAVPFIEWMMIGNLRAALRSNSWPTTEGLVTKSEVTWDLRRAQPVYSPDLSYDYQVGGKPYQGSEVRVGGLTTKSKADAEAIVTQFPAGKKVAVHYDPDNPAACCLITGTHWPHYLVVVSPLFFWALAVFYFYAMWTNARKAPQAQARE